MTTWSAGWGGGDVRNDTIQLPLLSVPDSYTSRE